MKARNAVLCGLFAALLCLCSWLQLPLGSYRLTLQTFGIFLTLGLLGGKRGLAAIAVYCLLGVVGLPVFSGFRGGVSVLLEPFGGYIWGFLLGGFMFLLGQKLRLSRPVRLLLALLSCYCAGTFWFSVSYGQGMPLGSLLLTCVVPYLLPDVLKLLLAELLIRRIKRYI